MSKQQDPWERYFSQHDVDTVEFLPVTMQQAAPAKSWTVTPDAGGTDPFDAAVDAFCYEVGIDPATLVVEGRKYTKTKRYQWARQMEKIADENGATAGQLEQAIRAKPHSTIDWKTWTTPWAARQDLESLVLQVKSGGVKQRAQNGKAQRNLEIIESWGIL